jgi:death on curing protein
VAASHPRWLHTDAVLAMHHSQVTEHGGLHGVRDASLLSSALSRPLQKHTYDDSADIFDFAAAYTFGIARNHPFVDGNKRTAFAAAGVFLGLNGYDFNIPEAEAVRVILEVASGKLSEEDLAAWYRSGARRSGG